MVEHPAVNRKVVGSSPTGSVKGNNQIVLFLIDVPYLIIKFGVYPLSEVWPCSSLIDYNKL